MMPAWSSPNVSGSALLLPPLLSLITFAGPMISAIPLGLIWPLTAVSGLLSTVMPESPLPMFAPGSVAEMPMRLPMMKLGSETPPAARSIPFHVLPLITLPGPTTFANGEPTKRIPFLPLGTAMLPVRSVPIMLPWMNTPARFSLKTSTPLFWLPEITLFVMCTGPSTALESSVSSWLAKLVICELSSGWPGKLPNRFCRKALVSLAYTRDALIDMPSPLLSSAPVPVALVPMKLLMNV